MVAHIVPGRGDALGPSGTPVFVDVQMLQTTANHHMLATGLAYPTYYRALFPDLRSEFTSVVNSTQSPACTTTSESATSSHTGAGRSRARLGTWVSAISNSRTCSIYRHGRH